MVTAGFKSNKKETRMKSLLTSCIVSLALIQSPAALAANSKPTKPVKINVAKIDINRADATTVARKVKGIGLKRAEAIVMYRKQHGDFKSLQQLANVKGISKRFIEKNAQYLNTVLKLK